MAIGAHVFWEIKRSVDILAAAERYGVVIGRNNMASCFLHEDRHPSLSFKDSRWHCFSCGQGGSIIDLVSRLFGIAPAEAVKKLNADFNLGLDLERPMPTEEIKRLQSDRALHKGFFEWEQRAWTTISDYLLRLRKDLDTHRPTNPDKPIDGRYIAALHERERVEYFADILISGTFEEKLELFRNRLGVQILDKNRRTGTTQAIKR